MHRPHGAISTGQRQDYWDEHTGPSNLPGEGALSAAAWPEEIAFYMTPEQGFAHRAMGPLGGRRVLEIGSGVGVHALHLAREGAAVVALDMSAPRLALLRRVGAEMGLAGRIHAVCAAAEHLPFRPDAFDIAYTKATLIHTDLPAALRECRRVLRPGGKGVFCEPTTANPFAWLYRRFLGPGEWRRITRYFSRREERRLAETFGNLATGSFYFTAFLAFYWQFGRRRLRRFQRWLRVLHGLDRLGFRILPPLARLAWFRVYVVEKR